MGIYLDHNATTPPDPLVLEGMYWAMARNWGNCSTLYARGEKARDAIRVARRRVATLIGAEDTERVVFTSGGTESNNLALGGVCQALHHLGKHVVTSMAEHSSVLQTCAHLESGGWAVSYVPVDGQGRVDPAAVARSITPETVLVSVMLANNEVGSVNPVADIAAVCREASVFLHADATQAAGKIAVDVDALGVDLLTLSAHKFYGPKGVGALWIRAGTPLTRQVAGGAQEHGLRAGTENVPAIFGMGIAADLALGRLASDGRRLRALRDRLWAGVREVFPAAVQHGDLDPGLPNVLNASFPGWDAEELTLALDAEGIEVGTGSACTTGQTTPSHVLLAMGVSSGLARSTLRFSLGRGNDEAQIDTVLEALARTVRRAA